MAILPISGDEAHIWLALPDELKDPELLDAYMGLLAPDERARRARYVFDKNKHEYLITRAVVRSVLSRYADVPPRDWVFEANHYGKPEILRPQIPRKIRFNLSNTAGLVACIVSLDREVGVDVEEMERAGQALDIADRFFSPFEVNALRSLPKTQQPHRFTTYWTLKESYIKARGMGLSIPLDQFSFLLREDQAPGIAFDPQLVDDPKTWQFARLRPTPKHMLAAAVRIRYGEKIHLSLRKTIPLVM